MNRTTGGEILSDRRPVALFWDQSLVWGLICFETLRKFEIPFHLVSAKEIAAGCLDEYRLLLVPGGWASHKMRALGEAGKYSIERFVHTGGSYLGFCGGAGLALSSTPALGLVPMERMELSERLPSASGEIWVRGIPNHPAWEGLPQDIPVSVWWPSQFNWHPLPRVLCLAAYRSTGKDFQVADLTASDVKANSIPWTEWEKTYGINLNPARIIGHPAIMEARYGKGKLLLSYPHLETPGDELGNRLFLNMLKYLDSEASSCFPKKSFHENRKAFRGTAGAGSETLKCLLRIHETVSDFINFGERHLLWKWRYSWLLSWKRGIRGLEYGMLAVMVKSLLEVAIKTANSPSSSDPWVESALKLEANVMTFCQLANRLLLEEKRASETGNLTKLGNVSKEVDRLRCHLFGNKMNHGGLSRTLFDELDRFLFHFLNRLQPS